jgi:hypothetical protein
MSGKHTPGPWTYEVHELSSGFSGIVYDAQGYCVGTDHLTEADARLIAAAPEMLEALRQIGLRYGPTVTLQDCIDLAQSIIAKAEGTSHD